MKRLILWLLLPTLLWAQATPWMPSKPKKVPIVKSTAPAADATAGQIYVAADGSLHYVDTAGTDGAVGGASGAPKTSYVTDPAAAVTALGTTGTIITPPGAYTIAANESIPVGITFAPMAGAVFTINTGVTLTINGPFVPQLAQVFNCVGTGKVVFGTTCTLAEVNPIWWGAKPDAVAANAYIGTDLRAPLQAAVDTFRPVRITEGSYYLSGSVSLPDQVYMASIAGSLPIGSVHNQYYSQIIRGTNGNVNNAGARGNCVISTAANIDVFIPKTVYGNWTTQAYPRITLQLKDISFHSPYSGAFARLFTHLILSTSLVDNIQTNNFGRIFEGVHSTTNIQNSYFIGQRDSVLTYTGGAVQTECWDSLFQNNYISGDTSVGGVILLYMGQAVSMRVTNNYFDFADTAIFFFYSDTSSGMNIITGNTFDYLCNGIRAQVSSNIMISSNLFRRISYAGYKAGIMAGQTMASPWKSINLGESARNVSVIGNTYNQVEHFIYLGPNGPSYGLTEYGNLSDGSAPTITNAQAWSAATPLEGGRMFWGSRTETAYPSPSVMPIKSCEFLGQGPSEPPWFQTLLASGTVTAGTSVAAHEGVARMNSSTSANSGVVYATGASTVLGGGEVASFVFQIPTTTGNQSKLGWSASLTTYAAAPADGVWIDITGTTLSGKVTTGGAGNITTTGTTLTISANTWYYGEIRINTAHTAAFFRVFSMAGAILWENNCATNATSVVPMMHGVVSVNTGTTAAPMMDIDYVAMATLHTPARAK